MLMLTVVPIVSVTRRGGRPATRYDHRGYISSFLAALLVLWLMVGTVAAAQRHYFSGSRTNCAQAVTIPVTVVTGPLNSVAQRSSVAISREHDAAQG